MDQHSTDWGFHALHSTSNSASDWLPNAPAFWEKEEGKEQCRKLWTHSVAWIQHSGHWIVAQLCFFSCWHACGESWLLLKFLKCAWKLPAVPQHMFAQLSLQWDIFCTAVSTFCIAVDTPEQLQLFASSQAITPQSMIKQQVLQFQAVLAQHCLESLLQTSKIVLFDSVVWSESSICLFARTSPQCHRWTPTKHFDNPILFGLAKHDQKMRDGKMWWEKTTTTCRNKQQRNCNNELGQLTS